MPSASNSQQKLIKRGTWSPEEDQKLVTYINKYGCWSWQQLPRFAGLLRTGSSCRNRWMNYLRPNIKRGKFSEEEDRLIIEMHKSMGNRWSAMAANLPGRTDQEIKTHWHSSLKKLTVPKTKLRGNPTSLFEEDYDVTDTDTDTDTSDYSTAVSYTIASSCGISISSRLSTVCSSSNSNEVGDQD